MLPSETYVFVKIFRGGLFLTACFLSGGTLLPRTQNKGLKRVLPYGRRFARTEFPAPSKESTISMCCSVKFGVLFGGFSPVGIVNAAQGNCKLRVRR